MTDQQPAAPDQQIPKKKTKRRIYRVKDTLIWASTQEAAVHHYDKRNISVRVATQEDILELLGLGVEIQEAGTPWKESVPRQSFELSPLEVVRIGDSIAHEDSSRGKPLLLSISSQLRAHITIPYHFSSEVRAAAKRYLDEAGDQATEEGMLAAAYACAEKFADRAVVEIHSSGDTPAAAEDPAVLGADDPSVLHADEIPTTAHHPV